MRNRPDEIRKMVELKAGINVVEMPPAAYGVMSQDCA